MISAKAIHVHQRHYDKLHHMMRLEWLAEDFPSYGDGMKVLKHEIRILSDGSLRCLYLINNAGMSTNSVDFKDVDYLLILDNFAIDRGIFKDES